MSSSEDRKAVKVGEEMRWSTVLGAFHNRKRNVREHKLTKVLQAQFQLHILFFFLMACEVTCANRIYSVCDLVRNDRYTLNFFFRKAVGSLNVRLV